MIKILNHRKNKWKKVKKSIYFYSLLFTFVHFCSLSFAAFQDTGWGPRAGGMGNTFTAIADDASAPLWNPAGIAQMEMFETAFMYNKLFAGIEDVNLTQMFASGAYPAAAGTFGFTFTDFALWGYYRENMVSAAYSGDLASVLKTGFPFMAGINLKYLTHSYTLDDRTQNLNDPVFEETSAGGFTPDIGFLLKPSNISFGVSALNILQPDVGLKTEDKVPMILKFGAAYRVGDWSAIGGENITPTADVSYRKPADNDADIKVSGGIETWFNYHTWAARLGGNDREMTAGFSYNKMLKESAVQLDYAVLFPLQLSGTSGSHRLALTFKFSLPEKRKSRRSGAKKSVVAPAKLPSGSDSSAEVVEPEPVDAGVLAKARLSADEKEKLKKEYYDTAYGLFNKGKYAMAIANWEKVLEIDPNHTESKNKITLAKKMLEEKKRKNNDKKNGGIPADAVDINTADADELRLAGFTRAQAGNIIKYREKERFEEIEDLLNVRGITSVKLESIKNKLTVK